MAAAGIIRHRAYWTVAAALPGAGFAWYLTALPHPVLKLTGYLMPVLLLCAALAVYRKIYWLAWLFILPQAGVTVYLFLAGVVNLNL